MNYNVYAYIVFLVGMYLITIHLGWVLYKNGEVYLRSLFKTDEHLIKPINNVLLIGYYLLNLGFTTLQLVHWETIISFDQFMYTLSSAMGKLILILALMHYFNIFSLLLFSRRKTGGQKIQEINH